MRKCWFESENEICWTICRWISVMTACLFLGRAIAVESELKERSEVSQWCRQSESATGSWAARRFHFLVNAIWGRKKKSEVWQEVWTVSAVFAQLMITIVPESDFFLTRFISPVMRFSHSCCDLRMNCLHSTLLFSVTDATIWCLVCFMSPPPSFITFFFYIFSVVGATSVSAGPKQPSAVCCLVETCNLPPSLSQTHNT